MTFHDAPNVQLLIDSIHQSLLELSFLLVRAYKGLLQCHPDRMFELFGLFEAPLKDCHTLCIKCKLIYDFGTIIPNRIDCGLIALRILEGNRSVTPRATLCVPIDIGTAHQVLLEGKRAIEAEE